MGRQANEVVVKASYRYEGSKFLLILFCLLFLPVGILILVKGLRIQKENHEYKLCYRGSFFWLCFWTVFFFPIAIILGIISGFELVRTDIQYH